jgi:hypothetical protein
LVVEAQARTTNKDYAENGGRLQTRPTSESEHHSLIKKDRDSGATAYQTEIRAGPHDEVIHGDIRAIQVVQRKNEHRRKDGCEDSGEQSGPR